ncbi:MAG TPA: hypothetical protein P5077_12650 [bacterium]|nr:hypothetical protein [bacterium]
MSKPQTAAGYSVHQTELAERVLLEVWSRLGEYREHLVLVGGLAPRYIVDQAKAKAIGASHCGTMDVDLGISIAVADLKIYRSIHDHLLEMGFLPGKNDRGHEQRHSFVKEINAVPVSVDFLTATYDGPTNSLMREIEGTLSAIQVEGLGLAFREPLLCRIEGELLSGGLTRETVCVCRAIPFVVLKALAFDKRREKKDAYDLVYVLRHATAGPRELAGQTTAEERGQASFTHAIETMRNHFQSPGHNGPFSYESFTARSGDATVAFAAVQDFLGGLT